MDTRRPAGAVDQDTPEELFSEFVDRARRHPELRDSLVELLPERIALYRGRSTNTTARMRGYLLAAFEEVGLPAEALPYVLEELESGRDAYLVAAAAKALRGLEGRSTDAVDFLLKAIGNIKYSDDALSFDGYLPSWPAANPTTAMDEILKTLSGLGVDARPVLPALESLGQDQHVLSPTSRAILEGILDVLRNTGEPGEAAGAHLCCSNRPGPGIGLVPSTAVAAGHRAPPAQIKLEDQDGHRLTFGEFFFGRPCVVVFFYTRCDNPNKCSLTITKLGRLQRRLEKLGLAEQIGTAAVSYDPDYDLPARLRAYGENRDVLFGANHRLLRSTEGPSALQDYFQLGVNYGPGVVNRHRIELYVLDGKGRVVSSFTRLQWDVEEVLSTARSLLNGRPRVGAPGAGRREDPGVEDPLGPQA
jgi:protein SCO1/2